ncbi:polysaccharide deacetylase [Nitrosopumilus ureiphilus]|uniref:Polysaccharide deacetylase n=2 Tax=Nitrosopumilus ureiphilus TaxID=1470067 RepID=A0A7D5RFH3_9ARCH|nr:polysaccharide deacetylase [Nitrosopumilus ureiphilus]
MKNIMSVDLEDYYCDLPFSEWPKYESRIMRNTEMILDLFEKYDVKATFFVLGYIAEKFPDLVKKISELGHEIASHSYAHIDLRKVSKEQFEEDFLKSINILEKITGKKVEGFRAPFFSINKSNYWVFEILSKKISYDSSIFPVRTQLYGIPNAPRFVYKPSLKNIVNEDVKGEFIEIPMATHRIPVIGNIPIAGGFYLRFFPYWYMKLGIKKMNKQGNPAMIYIHPKDLDPEMPRIKEYNWYYYYNLKSAFKKFEKLLQDFKFGTVKDVLVI